MQRRVPAKDPPRSSSPPHSRSGRTATTQARTLRISVETAGPDRAAEGFPDRLSTRMAVALSLRTPETAWTRRLAAHARKNRRAPYPGTGRSRCKGDIVRVAFKAWKARAAPSNWGSEAGLALGGGRRSRCAPAIPKNPSHLALLRSPQPDPSPAHIPRLCAA